MDEQALKDRMQGVLENIREEISTLRTGRATPSLVENVLVDAYGGAEKMRVMELASITAPDPTSLLITPWDKSVVGEIRKGIESANVNLTPVISGETIRINLPPLTQEDRENYVKILSQRLEQGRVALRQTRQDGMHAIRGKFEEKAMGEDEKDLAEKKLQDLTDEFMKKLEEMGKAKETELRTV
ncbi:MAG: ribosome recycling factor [bacterium]|nr:ribosome recycling factor [bacterium]